MSSEDQHMMDQFLSDDDDYKRPRFYYVKQNRYLTCSQHCISTLLTEWYYKHGYEESLIHIVRLVLWLFQTRSEESAHKFMTIIVYTIVCTYSREDLLSAVQRVTHDDPSKMILNRFVETFHTCKTRRENLEKWFEVEGLMLREYYITEIIKDGVMRKIICEVGIKHHLPSSLIREIIPYVL